MQTLICMPLAEWGPQKGQGRRVGDRQGCERAALAGGSREGGRVSCPREATGAAQVWPDQGTEKCPWEGDKVLS